jgi:membrane protein implicated in regulation of membrane protease activity
MQMSAIDWLLFFGELLAVFVVFAMVILAFVFISRKLAQRYDSVYLGDHNPNGGTVFDWFK